MRTTRCSSTFVTLFILLGSLCLKSQANEREIIHPLCFEPFTGLGKTSQSSGNKTINLNNCQNKYIKYPFKQPTAWQAVFEKMINPKITAKPAYRPMPAIN